MKKVLSAFFVVLLVGCSSAAFDQMANIGQVSVENDTFNGSSIVELSPAWAYEDRGSPSLMKMGAHWNSSSPDYVAVTLLHTSSSSASDTYLNFYSVDFNVDGDRYSVRTSGSTNHDRSEYNSVSQTIYTSSSNRVIITMEQFQAILSAKTARARVHSSDGYMDVDLKLRDVYGQLAVGARFDEFMSVVEQQPRTKI